LQSTGFANVPVDSGHSNGPPGAAVVVVDVVVVAAAVVDGVVVGVVGAVQEALHWDVVGLKTELSGQV